MRVTLYSIIVILIAVFCSFRPAGVDVECKNFLRDFFKQNNSFDLMKSGRVVNMKYETIVTYNKTVANPPNHLRTNIFMRGPYFFLKNSNISIYKDSDDYFFLNHGTHMIIWSVPNKAFSIDKFWGITTTIQDSFINKARAIQCSYETLGDGDTIRKIVAEQQQKYAQLTRIRSASFKIRIKDMFMTESVLKYVEESAVSEVKNIFENVTTTDTFSFPSDIRQLLFNDKSQLKSEFRAYKLVDLRKKKGGAEQD